MEGRSKVGGCLRTDRFPARKGKLKTFVLLHDAPLNRNQLSL
jgi:hypothetical protein